MTEKDKMLIEEAENTFYCDWFNINPSEADTEEARDRLHVIKTMLHHKEEYMSGNL